MNTEPTYQRALLERDETFVLEIGPSHADAALVIRDGDVKIEAPGVDTYISRAKLDEIRDIIDFAIRMGYGE